MVNCVIVDDEPLAREILTDFIGRIKGAVLIGCFHNAKEALAFLQNNSVDLLFLDIEMPDITGIALLQSLRNPPPTIFTTAYRDYALEGYELGVVDFLLKPFSFARFFQAFERGKELLVVRNQQQSLETDANAKADHLFVKSGLTKIKLLYSDITHIQGWKDYAIIHCGGKRIVVKGSVKSMESLFNPDQFIRVHKSFIVAKAKIDRIDKNKITIGMYAIPVGRSYKVALEKKL